MRSANEIAQFQLGDLTFKVQYSHFTYSSTIVKILPDKVLSDVWTWVLTTVL